MASEMTPLRFAQLASDAWIGRAWTADDHRDVIQWVADLVNAEPKWRDVAETLAARLRLVDCDCRGRCHCGITDALADYEEAIRGA